MTLKINELIDFLLDHKKKSKTIERYSLLKFFRRYQKKMIMFNKLDLIMNEVCIYFDCDKERILQLHPNRDVISQRRIAIYLMVNLTKCNRKYIAEYFSNNGIEFTTNAITKANIAASDFIGFSQTIKQQINDLESILKPYFIDIKDTKFTRN